MCVISEYRDLQSQPYLTIMIYIRKFDDYWWVIVPVMTVPVRAGPFREEEKPQ
jgi:hypothetical protein